MKTPEEKRLAQIAATKRWLNKPGNWEKHRASVKRCRQVPKAKEIHRERQLGYAANHREQEKLRSAKWRAKYPEKTRELYRQRYLKAKDAVKEYNRKYRADHPQAVSIWARNRNARKRAGGGGVTRKFILDLFVVQNGKCLICHVD